MFVGGGGVEMLWHINDLLSISYNKIGQYFICYAKGLFLRARLSYNTMFIELELSYLFEPTKYWVLIIISKPV